MNPLPNMLQVQKSKTFRTSWANALKERPDDESGKGPTETSQMVYQKTSGRLADKKRLRTRKDTEKHDS